MSHDDAVIPGLDGVVDAADPQDARIRRLHAGRAGRGLVREDTQDDGHHQGDGRGDDAPKGPGGFSSHC